jgi:leucyl aminopeptidase
MSSTDVTSDLPLKLEAVVLSETETTLHGKLVEQYDALVVVAPEQDLPSLPLPSSVVSALQTFIKVDKQATGAVTLLVNEAAPGHRLIWSPVGSLTAEGVDVRIFGDAARKGMVRATEAGAVRPLLVVGPQHFVDAPEFERVLEVCLLSALAGLYQPLQAREALPNLERVEIVGFWFDHRHGANANRITKVVTAIEDGRRLARDVGGADPERMAPKRCAQHIASAFSKRNIVEVEMVEDVEEILREYPLLGAVARCSLAIERHRPVVVRLEYKSTGSPNEILMFAGKGVTYDTGGADVKTGGHMAGMSRDKCGAANIAGFFKILEHLQPPGLHVFAELGFVRNSIGAGSYVADEIITGHSGVRMIIANTDAEGRLVLSDCISHLREKYLNLLGKKKNESSSSGSSSSSLTPLPPPRMMTMCTLTGHAGMAVGQYSVALDNRVAKREDLARKLQAHGEVWGDPLEVSTLRREDVNFVAAKNKTHDVVQANTVPSSVTSRGHQYPAALIIKAGGLDKHGFGSEIPIAFTHLDIAGSAVEGMDYRFGTPTAAPIVALTARYVLDKF